MSVCVSLTLRSFGRQQGECESPVSHLKNCSPMHQCSGRAEYTSMNLFYFTMCHPIKLEIRLDGWLTSAACEGVSVSFLRALCTCSASKSWSALTLTCGLNTYKHKWFSVITWNDKYKLELLPCFASSVFAAVTRQLTEVVPGHKYHCMTWWGHSCRVRSFLTGMISNSL